MEAEKREEKQIEDGEKEVGEEVKEKKKSKEKEVGKKVKKEEIEKGEEKKEEEEIEEGEEKEKKEVREGVEKEEEVTQLSTFVPLDLVPARPERLEHFNDYDKYLKKLKAFQKTKNIVIECLLNEMQEKFEGKMPYRGIFEYCEAVSGKEAMLPKSKKLPEFMSSFSKELKTRVCQYPQVKLSFVSFLSVWITLFIVKCGKKPSKKTEERSQVTLILKKLSTQR